VNIYSIEMQINSFFLTWLAEW